MRSFILLLVLAQAAYADGFDDLRLRWRDMLTGGPALDATIPQVASRLTSIASTGNSRWSSMQKTSTRASLWTDIASKAVSADVSSNYGRLRDMAIAWATPGQSLYQSSALLADIISGLDWMDSNRYNSKSVEYDNWWDWEIGTPAYLVDIGVLLYDQLTADQLARYMGGVIHFDSNPAIMIVNTVSTGANRADKCKNALLRGVIMRDAAEIAQAVQLLSPVFPYVTSSDGFYVDGSFIQHTAHPYTGSYGLVLLQDVTNLLYLLSGSPWDITDPGKANVTKWVTDSFMPLIWEGGMMDMVRGRAISRTSSSDHVIGHSTIAYILRWTQFAPPADVAPVLATVKRWLLDDTLNYATSLPIDLIPLASALLQDNTVASASLPSASRVYASMDRAVHLRPTWAAGIAMHSTRIYNYESINNENLHGWHTGDGMTYLYNADLTQFSGNFWPTVDPQRLPGTTVIAGATEQQSLYGGSNAVGGASVDAYSAVMMQLNPTPRQLNAKKSWFLFDSELVALGADIRSTSSTATVETIVENRALSKDVAFYEDPDGAWASLTTGGASIGYYFPRDTSWKAQRATRAGTWISINAGYSAAQVTDDYQTIWFDHGVMPSAASYAYVLLPGMGPEATASYAAAPATRIVQNDARAQAVANDSLGIQAVNFWTAATSPVGVIQSDAAASVILHHSNGALNIAVADPTQTNTGMIHVIVNFAAQSVVSQDSAVTVEQLSPFVKLAVNVKGAAGRSLRASLAQ